MLFVGVKWSPPLALQSVEILFSVVLIFRPMAEISWKLKSGAESI